MGKGREVSFNISKCFSAFVKISPCGTFKKFKTNKAVLTTVIGRKEMIMMKTFLGNISAQKKNHLEIFLGTATWLWF